LPAAKWSHRKNKGGKKLQNVNKHHKAKKEEVVS
jgi:hypothetical protein